MLVNAHLYATNAYAAPVFHLRRLAGGGLFANYAQSFEAVWGALNRGARLSA